MDEFGMPFTGYDFKGFGLFGLCLLLGLAYRSGVDPVSNLLSGFIPSLPRIGKTDFGVSAQGQQFFLAVKTVAEPPPFVDSICSANPLK